MSFADAQALPDLDKEAAKALLKQLRDEPNFPNGSRNLYANIVNALTLSKRAQQDGDQDTAAVLFREATRFAEKSGEPAIIHQVVLRKIDRFNLPPTVLAAWYERATEKSDTAIQLLELIGLFSDDLVPTNCQDHPDVWQAAQQSLEKEVSKKYDDDDAGFRLATKRLAGTGDRLKLIQAQPEGYWPGLKKILIEQDIAAGIEQLSECDVETIKATAMVVKPNDEDVPASFEDSAALLQALMDQKETNCHRAAESIFKTMLSDLTLEQLQRGQEICYSLTETNLSADAALPCYGLGNQTAVPGKMPSQTVFDPDTKTWNMSGRFEIGFPLVKAVNFVHEIDLAFATTNGWLKFRYGSRPSLWLFFGRGDDTHVRFEHRMGTGNGPEARWDGSHTYPADKMLKFRLYCIGGRQIVVVNGKKISEMEIDQDWLDFDLGGDTFNFVLSRCLLRPWLPGDQDALSAATDDYGALAPVVASDWKKIQDLAQHGAKLPQKARQTETFVNASGMLMQSIGSGEYKRDSTQVVFENPFWMSRHEITQSQWQSLSDSNPATIVGSGYLPVDNVSYDAAVEFCDRLTAHERRRRRLPKSYIYRLPTAAEWEYCCLADDADAANEFSKERFWNRTTCRGRFRQVGTSQANGWGLFDMQGNVEEWTLDEFRSRSTVAREIDPAYIPRDEDSKIVVKGGGWWNSADVCRPYKRCERDRRAAPYRGFRVILAKPVAK